MAAATTTTTPYRVLVTGAAGYIGSHAVRDLLLAGHTCVGIDNFSTSQREALPVLQSLAGAAERFSFVEGSVGDAALVEATVREHNINAVIHFAAYANLRESLSSPQWALSYYRNNTACALGLLEGIEAAGGVERFVFSSTCCTYGDVPAELVPIDESTPTTGAAGAYGKSKLAIEFMLRDYHAACTSSGKPFALAVLRYFNVAGCALDGALGEARDKQIRIIPILLDAALGKRDGVSIFGTDFATRDGTAIRDYIHVEDLARAHSAVLGAMEGAHDERLYNLGIGKGYSIRELIASTERVTGVTLKVTETPRVAGEAAEVFCNPAKVAAELGWKCEITEIDDIIRSAFEFFKAHPNGYKK
jgi:UDP-glucose 4-epimerase